MDWPAEIRAALSCGHYRLTGHDQTGTVHAIKLVSEKGPHTCDSGRHCDQGQNPAEWGITSLLMTRLEAASCR